MLLPWRNHICTDRSVTPCLTVSPCQTEIDTFLYLNCTCFNWYKYIEIIPMHIVSHTVCSTTGTDNNAPMYWLNHEQSVHSFPTVSIIFFLVSSGPRFLNCISTRNSLSQTVCDLIKSPDTSKHTNTHKYSWVGVSGKVSATSEC